MRGRKDRSNKRAEVILAAIEATGGQVVKACKASQISLSTFYDWQKSDPEFKAKVDTAIDRSTHVLETECVRRALAGADTLLMFLLKGRLPDKYRDRQEVRVSLADATADQIQAALDKLSEDQLRAIIAKRTARSDGSTDAGSANGQGSITR